MEMLPLRRCTLGKWRSCSSAALSFTSLMSHVCPLSLVEPLSVLTLSPLRSHTHTSQQREPRHHRPPESQQIISGWWSHWQPCHWTAWLFVYMHAHVYCKPLEPEWLTGVPACLLDDRFVCVYDLCCVLQRQRRRTWHLFRRKTSLRLNGVLL